SAVVVPCLAVSLVTQLGLFGGWVICVHPWGGIPVPFEYVLGFLHNPPSMKHGKQGKFGFISFTDSCSRSLIFERDLNGGGGKGNVRKIFLPLLGVSVVIRREIKKEK